MAGGEMGGGDFAEGRGLGAAAVHGHRTAGVKRTAGRRMDRGRHIAGQHDALALGIRVHFRYGGYERLGVGMLRLADEGLGFGQFHDFAEVHDHHAAADVLDHGEIVRNEQIGDAALLLEVAQQVDDLRLHGDVERADGFVADDEFGFHGEGAGDADALALAAAEFVGITPGVRGVQPDGLEQFGDALLAGGFASGERMNIQRLADDLLDGHARIERPEGVLKNHLKLPATGAQGIAGHAGDVLAVQPDGAGGGVGEPHDGAAEGGLAAAAFADQTEGLAGREAEGDAVHGFDRFMVAPEQARLDGEMNL